MRAAQTHLAGRVFETPALNQWTEARSNKLHLHSKSFQSKLFHYELVLFEVAIFEAIP